MDMPCSVHQHFLRDRDDDPSNGKEKENNTSNTKNNTNNKNNTINNTSHHTTNTRQPLDRPRGRSLKTPRLTIECASQPYVSAGYHVRTNALRTLHESGSRFCAGKEASRTSHHCERENQPAFCDANCYLPLIERSGCSVKNVPPQR